MKNRSFFFFMTLFFSASSGAQNNPCQESDSTLILNYSFDHVGQTTFYNSANLTQSGQIKGASLTDGICGKGMKFDGRDDFLQVNNHNLGNVIDTLQFGSLIFWFNTGRVATPDSILPLFFFTAQDISSQEELNDSTPNYTIEIGHGHLNPRSQAMYFTVHCDISGRPGFCVDSGNRRRHVVSQGQWHQAAIVVQPEGNKIFFDGQDITNISTFHMNSSSKQSTFLNEVGGINTLLIGKSVWFGKEVYFKGIIDEVKIYNRRLSAMEIANSYVNILNHNTQNK